MKRVPTLLLLLLAMGFFSSMFASSDVSKISAAEAAKLVEDGKAVLVDVREANEWKGTGVAKPAVLLAKSDFDGAQTQWKPFLDKVGDKQVIVYCRSGARSGVVAKSLAAKGVKVSNAGGFKEWADAGLPTRKVE